MRFTVRTRGAAEENSDSAKLRESTRIAMIANGLFKSGHSVFLAKPNHELLSSNRWHYFSELPVDGKRGGLYVGPSKNRNTPWTDVIVKTTVSVKHDDFLVKSSKVLVAHEIHDDFSCYGSVLNCPFFIHDRVVDDMACNGTLPLYMNDEIDELRSRFDYTKTRDVGFIGYGWKSRKTFFENAPDWVEHRFYESHPMGGWEHAQWLCGCKAVVSLPGDTPKTNLTPLLALLGIPIISTIIENNTPPLDEESMILFESWGQVEQVLGQQDRLDSIAENATKIYLEGWSPIGIARQIVERIH